MVPWGTMTSFTLDHGRHPGGQGDTPPHVLPLFSHFLTILGQCPPPLTCGGQAVLTPMHWTNTSRHVHKTLFLLAN